MPDLTKKFAGKKLLLLGTNAGTCDMVNYARSQGAYVIVTDNLPPEKSTAKQIADEAWPVSTADADTLERLAIQHKINGIFAGVSEFNLEKAMTLCERLGLPFYCNRKQWEIFFNKQRFKQYCRDNGVPVAKEYIIRSDYSSEDLQQIQYPVIVKPVDSSSGIGVSICNDEKALLTAYSRSISLSKTNKAIIEQLVVGDEFTAAYTIKDCHFSLSYTTDRCTNLPGETSPLPVANILPSKYTDQYIREVNPLVIKMFKGIGLANGVIFVQAIVNNDGFHIFEANYRAGGFLIYRFTSRINRINYMEMLVNYALIGKMGGYDLGLDNPKFNKCCCNLNLISKGGIVGKILGLEDISKKKNLIAIDKIYDVGDYIEKSGTLRQIHLRFYLIEETPLELKNSVKEIQDTVKVLDDKGQDMLLPPFDVNRINMTLG